MKIVNVISIELGCLAFFTICLRSVWSVSCAGCVDLDELSFNKTIRRFPYALVKFDIAFPYGEQHNAFADLARAAHGITDELLVATVGIKDYGEMENKEVGLRFGLNDKNLPGIVLFKNGNVEQPIMFPSYLTLTAQHLKEFINENTPLYIGCDGCLKQFNVAIKNFANLAAAEQLQVVEKLEAMLEQLENASEQISAKAYVLFARKIYTEGYEFVEIETKRLSRLRAGRITSEKKEELRRKLNILYLFRVANVAAQADKDDL